MAANCKLGRMGTCKPCAPVGCSLTVDTTWCQVVAPGVITVTVHSGTITGPVVCTGTADALGKYVCTISTAGTYVAVASTSSSGYLNAPGTVVITSAPTSGNCTPATVRTVIYPAQMTATGFWGSKVLSPTGGANLCASASGDFSYTGTVTGWSSPAACGCAAEALSIDLAFIPCGSFGQTQPWLLFCFLTQRDPILGTVCPGVGPGTIATTGFLSGTGPVGSGVTGYPVNLSGTYSFPASNDARAILYGCCTTPTDGCSTGCTVTQ
jgi:hypothetical protein